MNTSAKNLIEAKSTPLASILGSGFLVIVPIPAGAVGSYALFATAAVRPTASTVSSDSNDLRQSADQKSGQRSRLSSPFTIA